MKKLTLSLAAVMLAGVACSSDQALADMELRALSGVVNVLRDGETINVEGAVELQPGDVIITKDGGFAKFALEGGADARQGQMQANSRVLVRSGSAVEAEEGLLLLQVTEPIRALVEGVTARSSDGVFRIDRGFGSVRTAVYEGSVELDAPGQADLAVSTLYQATLVAGDLPSQTRPYRLDEEDAWDRALLGEVVDLEEDLALLARGLGSQLGRQRPGLNYFRALIDGGNVSFMGFYLNRKPPDLLIGFTIARIADGPLERAFKAAFDLYDQGARWGVAAKILDVEPRPIVAQLERLILGTGVVAADGSGNRAEFTVAAADASETGAAIDGAAAPPSSSSTTTETQEPNEPNEPNEPDDPDDPNNPPEEPPEDPDECSDTASCAVEDVEDQLPGPEPSPSPTEEQKGAGLLDGGL
jgi:hypothetical protein